MYTPSLFSVIQADANQPHCGDSRHVKQPTRKLVSIEFRIMCLHPHESPIVCHIHVPARSRSSLHCLPLCDYIDCQDLGGAFMESFLDWPWICVQHSALSPPPLSSTMWHSLWSSRLYQVLISSTICFFHMPTSTRTIFMCHVVRGTVFFSFNINSVGPLVIIKILRLETCK